MSDQEVQWISADHIPNFADLHQIMVAVDPHTGAVLDPQPDYPTYEPPPVPPDPPVAEPAAAKSTTTTK
jgi:hypothetical protein